MEPSRHPFGKAVAKSSLVLALTLAFLAMMATLTTTSSSALAQQTFSPGPMYVLWSLSPQFGRSTSAELISYNLATGASVASDPIANSTSSFYTLDAVHGLFYAVIQSGPSDSDSSLVTFDVSTDSPSVKSTCQLATMLDNAENMTQCIFSAQSQHYILVTSYGPKPTSQLYLIDLFTCETTVVQTDLPAMYGTSKCNYFSEDNELYYLSLLPFADKLVILNVGTLQYDTVAFPSAALIHRSIVTSQIDPKSGDLYVYIPFTDQDISLWYLPNGGSSSQWVHLCNTVSGACPSYTVWSFIGIDNRYTAATFNNECLDGYPPTATNPSFEQAPILMGEDGYLQSFAYSVYLNCIVWKGVQPSEVIYGGWSVPSYNPNGALIAQ